MRSVHALHFVGAALVLAGCGSHTTGQPNPSDAAPEQDATVPEQDASGADDGGDAASFDAAALHTEQLAACGATPTVVYTGFGPSSKLAGGGGVLAYAKEDGGVWRAPAASQITTEIVPGVAPWSLSVDDRYVAYTVVIDPSPPGSFRLRSFDAQSGADRSLYVGVVNTHASCGGRVFFWETPDSDKTWVLYSAPEDGSAPPTAVTTQTTFSFAVCDGTNVAWVDDQGAITTTPVAGGPLTTHTTVPQQQQPSNFLITAEGLYFVQDGTRAADGFLPFTIVREPLDGGATTTIATSLPENFPPQSGSYYNSASALVRGPHHLFWAECWGGVTVGGGHFNWVLRRVDPSSGGAPDVVDSFSWTPSSPTPGLCPQLLGDGAALYYTREGSLMRLCD